jgi:2,6-dihydroxypyridine 3-monooxygenase
MVTRSADVIVVGGSLGGVSAANWLSSIGRSVIVLERSANPLVGRGAGIVLHPSTARFLLERGTALDDFSIATDTLRYLGEEGEVVHEQPSPLRYVSYGALHRRLLAAFDRGEYRLGAEVTAFSQDADTVRVRTADGADLRAGMLVCADGIRSAARARLLPSARLEYAGYVAWRGTVPYAALEDPEFGPLHGAITYTLLDRSHLLTYPIGGRDGDEALCNWLWYRNLDDAMLDSVLTDATGTVNPLSVQPGLLSPAACAALQRAAAAELPPNLQSVVSATRAPFLQAIFDCTVAQMAFGRICLLGDAGFVARPHAAAGTAKACEEAALLAGALDGGSAVATALGSWQESVLEIGARLVQRARRAGDAIAVDGSWRVGDRLPFGLYADGDSAFSRADEGQFPAR